MNSRRSLLPLLLLAALAVSWAFFSGAAKSRPEHPKAPASFFGIAPQTPLEARDLRLMQEHGVGSLRWTFAWSAIEPTPGHYDWAWTDSLMSQANSIPVTVLPILADPPAWMTSDPRNMPVANKRQKKEWAQFCRAVVGRYGVGGSFWSENPQLTPKPITVWQIWNEANDHYFAHASVPQYAQLLKVSSSSIRSVNPTAHILLSGLFATPVARPPKAMPATTFLAGLYKRGAGRTFDDVAVHPYAKDPRAMMAKIKDVRAVMNRFGDRQAGIWITEFGWGSATHNPTPLDHGTQGQARFLSQSYHLLINKRKAWKIRSAYWFTWRDVPEVPGGCSFCDSVGLLGVRGAKKAALSNLGQLAAGR